MATVERAPAGTVEWVDSQVVRLVLPLPLPDLDTVNAYAIVGDDDVTLIDPGWASPENEAALSRALAVIGKSPESVDRILVTHAHWDHYTQALAWQERFGTDVYLGSGERPTVEALDDLTDGPYPEQVRLLRRAGALALARDVQALGLESYERDQPAGHPDVWLHGGEHIVCGGRRLLAHATPGHTGGHIVFEDLDGGSLFTGDHILPRITPSLAFERVPQHRPLRAYLDSLRLFVDRPDVRMLPAHGAAQPGTSARAQELVDHHRGRLATVADLVAAGHSTASAVAERMRWTRRNSTLAQLGTVHGMTAVLEIAAHLELLVDQGILTEETTGTVVRYRA
jgi:glyoxylase-like metal-dependent hydrolase (beta-lactamase superfamily II)